MTHIVKEKLVADISEKIAPLVAVGCNEKYVYGKTMECIEKAQPVDARPVVYAEWLNSSKTMVECSNCKKHAPRHRYSFCPFCGAEMSKLRRGRT